MKIQGPLLYSGKTPLLAVFLALTLGLTSISPAAQSTVEPRREQLLNGLRVLIWHRPNDANVLLKLRIHSGAAFDLAGKAGTMALLGDALFSDPNVREFFVGELSGSLDVTTDYDAINVSLSGRAAEFERIVDLLRGALVSTPLTAETVTKLREARIKVVRDTSLTPAVIADRAIAARLFGDHPYGRPFSGATDTLARIDRADLLYARERFLNPNNATLVVVGGVDERRALRALRQLLGAWRKSETVVPATFRQPETPDTRTLLIDLPGAEAAEVRLAARALTRSDRDYAASTLLALLARDRWQASAPELSKSAFYVRHETHVLPGMFVMGASVRTAEAANTLAAARNVIRSLINTPPTPSELERLKGEAVATFNKQIEQPESIANMWLDIEAFKLAPIADQLRTLSNMTQVDVQGVAARIFREAPVSTVVVGNAAQLRAELERAGKVEVMQNQAAPAAQPVPSSPTTKRP